MTTLFDIGDKITFKMAGTIEEYTKSKSGDCYRIKLESDNPSTNGLWVYLDTESLLVGNAKLIEKGQEK